MGGRGRGGRVEVLWRGVGRAGLRMGTGAGDLGWEAWEERAVGGSRLVSGVGGAGVGGGGCVAAWLGGRGGAGEEWGKGEELECVVALRGGPELG